VLRASAFAISSRRANCVISKSTGPISCRLAKGSCSSRCTDAKGTQLLDQASIQGLVHLVAEGRTNKGRFSRELNLRARIRSVTTCFEFFNKLGTSTRLELALYAIKHGQSYARRATSGQRLARFPPGAPGEVSYHVPAGGFGAPNTGFSVYGLCPRLVGLYIMEGNNGRGGEYPSLYADFDCGMIMTTSEFRTGSCGPAPCTNAAAWEVLWRGKDWPGSDHPGASRIQARRRL
jgi:hypothetical protein